MEKGDKVINDKGQYMLIGYHFKSNHIWSFLEFCQAIQTQ